jgi:hypothetical protein
MKYKNILLGAAAAMIAICAAFVSNAKVLGKFVKAGTPLTCKAIVNVECGQQGPRACAVAIDGVIYPVFSDAACTIPVSTTLTQPIPSSFE